MATLDELKFLTDRLDIASRLYYNGLESEFSDTEFDLMFHTLRDMEKELNFTYPNSPTLRVGSDIQDGFGKISHPSPMLTIENVYSDKELEEWIKKIRLTYGADYFNLSVKYDGVSCELHYKNGVFVSASTRGDKNIGDNITENVKTIRNFPLVIPRFENIPDVYIRGEILMRKSTLAKLNEERMERGENLFSNTRNACAGSIKQLDPKVTANRNLIFKAWDILSDNEMFDRHGNNCFNSMSGKYSLLREVGFHYDSVTFPITALGEHLIEDVHSFYNNIKCAGLDYDFDGVVIKIEDCNIQKKIGTKDTRAIEWGIARKWNEEYSSKTIINDVDWQVGRTGVVTPVAILEPVECSGVIVSSATLHNVDVVRENDIHLGNYVDIVRSGGVIPYVQKIYHDLLMEMNGAYPKVEIPKFCPICGSKLVQDGKILKCTNKNCSAIQKGILLQFCSKEACNIKSIGESVIDDLYNSGLITNVRQIISTAYKWSICKNTDKVNLIVDILGKGYGSKSVIKMLDEMVGAMKNVPANRVLSGLSIPGVGKVTARNLMKHFGSMEHIKNATIEELSSIDGIGNVVSLDIFNWIREEGDIFDKLKEFGWNTEIKTSSQKQDTTGDLTLSGMTVCFTGKSFRFSGDDVEKFLEGNGAKCTHSISKTMDYLILGEKPGGSKVDKANGYGIKIISERDFYEKFKI